MLINLIKRGYLDHLRLKNKIFNLNRPDIPAYFFIFVKNMASSDTRHTNLTNMAINVASMAHASKMQANEQAYNTTMWEKNNEYNNPSAQAKRFRAAGLNPAMMLYGGNTNEATAASSGGGSSPSMIPMQNPATEKQMKKQMALDSARQISDSMSEFAERGEMESQANLNNANAQSINIENGFKEMMLRQAIARDKALAGLYGSEKEGHDIQNDINRRSADAAVQVNNQQPVINEMNMAKQAVDMCVAQEMLPVMKEAKRAEAAELISRAAANCQNINESKARERFLTKQADEIVQRMKLTNYSPDQLKRYKESVVKLIEAQAAHQQNNTGPDGLLGVPNLLSGPGSFFGRVGSLFKNEFDRIFLPYQFWRNSKRLEEQKKGQKKDKK